MKPRKLNIKTVPASDTNRAYRFWRDVFDLPQSGHQSGRHLMLDGEDIIFVPGQPTDKLELLVRDHQDNLKKHLRNNFVPIVGEPKERFGNKIAFQISDSEGNLITIESNK
ncbi:lactoylglutathione lyase [Leuconostoc carnosum]|uniref:Lactoylglutathione lyase related lyase n=2 Tax=Leuconostoc carnosum TaxID=1252 RepID=K0DBM9_LEUCJ|nr:MULTISPECIES: lactoylglutathione lyase [Leuconostoc]AFT80967.1 lactoylglutathione lyase related lyase [Leuconostoc carnosum JB16]KAA8327202.1 lactoylglutathione lyase [Leuconostoc carnosum]KAA8332333.1 lactoylglutathione lyase [Leuconostoc carnosum]KAA8364291.1 lactoylglutathione lyase [Leuconostoc carnosum]KAA8367184.1 lactoylglutathione lyase [Leuconostoc carnosum]